jgi:hypothetical protein
MVTVISTATIVSSAPKVQPATFFSLFTNGLDMFILPFPDDLNCPQPVNAQDGRKLAQRKTAGCH